jgi:hypothetical protein
MLAKWPWPLALALLEPALFNGARGFSRFNVVQFCFRVSD